MPLGPQIVTYGNIQSSFVLTLTLTPALVTTITTVEQSFTVPGLLVGDQVSGVTFQGVWNVLMDFISYRVISNNTLAITFQNTSAGSLTPPAGVYLVEINRPMPGMAMTAIQ